MIRRYQSVLSKLYIAHDLLWATVCLVLAWWLRFHTNLLPHYHGSYTFVRYMSVLAVAFPGFVAGAGMTGLYSATRNNGARNLALQIFKSVVVMALIVMSLLYFEKQVHYSRAVLLFFLAGTWLTVFAGRLVVREALKLMRVRGLNRKFILIVGVTSATNRFLAQIARHGEFGYHPIGYLDMLHSSAGAVLDGDLPCLGGLDQLDAVLGAHIVDHVILTLPHDATSLLGPLIAVCESHGVHAMLVPDFLDILPNRPKFEDFAGLPIVDTRYAPLDDALNAFFKRTFDIVFSALVLVALSPLYALIALAVRFSSPGPVIYRQERLGKNRRTFHMYKFRTMRSAADVGDSDEDDTGWTVPHDPRCTALGRVLRATSLDELPQFWNVLRGDMSVIGPRPERPHFVEQFRADVPRYMIKHRVRPGITGWAQVNGLRGDTSIEERIEYDLRYIEDWSFAWDLRIVLLTIVRGMRHKNAY